MAGPFRRERVADLLLRDKLQGALIGTRSLDERPWSRDIRAAGLWISAEHFQQECAQRAGRLVRGRLVEFEVMSERFAPRKARDIEGMIGAGIDDERDRSAFAL